MANKYKDHSSNNLTSFFFQQNELDFHLYDKLDPFEVEKILFEFIEDNYLLGNKFLLVITGHGKLVRPLVRKLLPKNKLVSEFKSANLYNGGKGAFEVILHD